MSRAATDDTELWRACLASDPAAFGNLWDRHRDAVFGAALGQAGNRFDAEDITAITFFEAWRLRHRVRVVNDTVLPWLLVTCKNVARNAARSRRRYGTMLSQLPPPPVIEHAGVVESRQHINAVLERLGAVDRTLLVLTAIDGFDIRQAAEQVGISHDAARARLSRAKARLRHAEGIGPLPEGALE